MWVIKFNKLVQLSQGNSLGSYWIICSSRFTTNHFYARVKIFGARILNHVWACARARFSFFRADMNLVCTKCNGARVSVWWTRAHKCDGWSYINMIDARKKRERSARAQIPYVRTHKYHTGECTNITRVSTHISHGRVHKYHTGAHTNSIRGRTEIVCVRT